MLTSFLRTIILFSVLILSLRLMGKRQIGELQPSELVVMIMISELAAIPMQDLGIPLLNGVIPILTLLGAEMLLSSASASSVKIRKILCGKPSVLIKRGVVDQRELKHLRVGVEELLEELRLKDVFDINSVSCAYLETNGQLSVLLKPYAQNATPAHLGIDSGLEPLEYFTVVAHGRILSETLMKSGKSERWLVSELRKLNIPSPEKLFLCVIDSGDNITAIPMEEEE